MANEKNLKPFKTGHDSRRDGNGRPAKLKSLLKIEGYKLSQVNQTICNLLTLNKKALTDIKADRSGKGSILELIIAGALLKDFQSGRIDTLETLLDRSFGRTQTQNKIDENEPLKKIEVIIVNKQITDKRPDSIGY